MSFEQPTHFVKQFGNNIYLLSQQKGSRLYPYVTIKPNVVGKEFFEDQLGATTAQRKTTRHGDTPLIHTPFARRKGVMYDYEWADLVDSLDKVKTLNDPTSKMVMNSYYAMGRSMDDEIITALNGTSYTGEEGATSVILPSAQQIGVDASGLTIKKILQAKEIMDSAEVNEAEDDIRVMLVTAKQVTNLLNTTEVKSSEYNTVKALAEGRIDSYCGFKFVRTQRLNVDGSNNRLCLAFIKSGICLAIGKNMTADIGPRRDKSMATQAYLEMSIGATRLEEVKVVEIACQES